MIVFHEGLPGAGKSYEACVMHIIPALQKGRRVLTNIEGINHDKFSQITSIPVSYLRQNLISIDYPDIEDVEEKYARQKSAILELSSNDSLIIIDEIQDLFPSQRSKLSVDWSKYIGSHRHDGNDIILMGQSFKDTHTFWRRRVKRKIVFTQKTALGQNSTYLWEAFEATQPEKFNKITSGSRKYDKKYFGLYDSVTSKTNNLDVYSDKRTVVWNSPTFKYLLPIAFCCAFFAVKFLFGFFSTPSFASAKNDISKHSVSSQQQQPLSRQTDNQDKSSKYPSDSPDLHSSSLESNSDSSSQSTSQSEQYDPIDVFDDLANRYKPRLSGYIRSSDKLFVRIQILDSSDHVKDIFSHDDLIDMGWTLTYRPSGLNVKKGDRQYLIRPWPVDSWGSVNRGTSAALGSNRVAVSPSAAASSKPNAILISHSPRPRSQFSAPSRRH